MHSALSCLQLIADFHQHPLDGQRLLHEFGEAPWSPQALVLAARSAGFSAKPLRQQPGRLASTPLPAIALARDGGCFVLAKAFEEDGVDKVLLQVPGSPPQVMDQAGLLSFWSGELVLLQTAESLAGSLARFDFSWFIPAIVKHRRVLAEVLAISLALQLIGLATPMAFQVVTDKVIVNHAVQTLDVVGVALGAAILFEVALTFLRTVAFNLATSKMDVELGARLYRHLLSLPIGYFHARRVGDSIARVRELEHLRSFLTGNAITLVLDLVFSSVFLAMMVWYSPPLSLIPLAAMPLYAAVSFVFTPIIRRRLNDKFARNAASQSFLVESVTGIDTVKALSLEPRWQERWDRHLAAYVGASLKVTGVSAAASGAATAINKVSGALILWFGASQVMQGAMTVGELIAFNMFAGQVASPILRMAQLWNDFQQASVSVERLGDILNMPAEGARGKPEAPRLRGALRLDDIGFRYRPDGPEILRGVSLDIPAGSVVGIVGRSGSGKSTIAKLLQRLYLPERGKVCVDNVDVSHLELTTYRRQIGTVLQESFLFTGSIKENLSVTRPNASFEDIVQVCRLAGAHAFICELPEGYDTRIGENGVGLSGGQKQRIAIARALLNDPRILIFDEATSALDFESERAIHENLQDIARGRTVIIIAHRLSTVMGADQIVVMERGQVAERGDHDTLIRQPGGIYAMLWRSQAGVGDRAARLAAPAWEEAT
ncbi:type I secretion system permease/ATPase [Mitsuaria sp. GD03876]|uniref:type I secretion system permease/ATPase n=1 Tax=Mitsuaria sp. GD03876 TaxID=2975399 RepID=UPI00244A0110|nr:type I secretion system permease/ATPase [Mitsuaria sp. GD03876]MDH0863933.1 type I secretion system permease/ATPase [Mitsuaria sp. GD03876]